MWEVAQKGTRLPTPGDITAALKKNPDKKLENICQISVYCPSPIPYYSEDQKSSSN